MPNNYQLISKAIVPAGGAANVTFSSIPSTFTDLKIESSARNTTAEGRGYIIYQFNGVSGVYGWNALLNYDANNIANFNGTSQTYGQWLNQTGNNALSYIYSNGTMYIPNYLSTLTGGKTSLQDSGSENNATSQIVTISACVSTATTAISSITLFSATSGASQSNSAIFAEHSSFYLYGIKNY